MIRWKVKIISIVHPVHLFDIAMIHKQLLVVYISSIEIFPMRLHFIDWYRYFRLLDIMNSYNAGYIVWQEVFDNKIKVRTYTVKPPYNMLDYNKGITYEVTFTLQMLLRTKIRCWIHKDTPAGPLFTKQRDVLSPYLTKSQSRVALPRCLSNFRVIRSI